MADTTTTPDTSAVQSTFNFEIDFHIMNMQAMFRSTQFLVNEVQNNLTPDDARGDVEALVGMFCLMRQHFDMMMDAQDRRDTAAR